MPRLITGLDAATIARNLERIKETIADAGRDPATVEILAAVKYVPIDEIPTLRDAGLTLLGENRAQELEDNIRRIKKRLDWALRQMEELDEIRRKKGTLDPDEDALYARCDRMVKRLKGVDRRGRREAEGYDDTITYGALAAEGFLPGYGLETGSILATTMSKFSEMGADYRVDYVPGESDTGLFGGNSNWRGPIWFPLNFLLVEALERYHHFYGDHVQVECPTGSGDWTNLYGASQELRRRLASIFLPDAQGRRPCHGDDPRYAADPHWRSLPLFYEYFHGDTGRGVGASHQTGWTALVATILRDARA